MTTINALEVPIQEISEDGKALYERSNPAKLKDYTYRQLLKRVRQAKTAQPLVE